MARMFFTQHLRRFVPDEPVETQGETLRAALDDLFVKIPPLRGYILDDQGRLRQHVCVFVGDERIDFRGSLDCPVDHSTEIYVMQALSGGRAWPSAFSSEHARASSS